MKKAQRHPIVCEHCGKELQVLPCKLAQKFCGKECAVEHKRHNEYTVRDDGIVEVMLTKGQVALVDKEDWERISKYRWTAHWERTGKKFSVHSRTTGETVQMHRLILSAPDGIDVDHINNISTDNRRSNLRLCNHSQNAMNGKKRYGESLYKGVGRRGNGWRAYITKDGKQHFLGLFLTEEDAARAYDAAAIRYFGEFARVNGV